MPSCCNEILVNFSGFTFNACLTNSDTDRNVTISFCHIELYSLYHNRIVCSRERPCCHLINLHKVIYNLMRDTEYTEVTEPMGKHCRESPCCKFQANQLPQGLFHLLKRHKKKEGECDRERERVSIEFVYFSP